MKFTIEGFNQQYAMSLKKRVTVRNGKVTKTIKIDCTDLVILRWFVDFYPTMRKRIIDGKQYALLVHSKIVEELPILGISKYAASDRMQKLVEFGLLEYKLIKKGGTYSYYTFGKNYNKIINCEHTTPYVETNKRTGSHTRGGGARAKDKYYSINNKSINDIYNNNNTSEKIKESFSTTKLEKNNSKLEVKKSKNDFTDKELKMHEEVNKALNLVNYSPTKQSVECFNRWLNIYKLTIEKIIQAKDRMFKYIKCFSLPYLDTIIKNMRITSDSSHKPSYYESHQPSYNIEEYESWTWNLFA